MNRLTLTEQKYLAYRADVFRYAEEGGRSKPEAADIEAAAVANGVTPATIRNALRRLGVDWTPGTPGARKGKRSALRHDIWFDSIAVLLSSGDILRAGAASHSLDLPAGYPDFLPKEEREPYDEAATQEGRQVHAAMCAAGIYRAALTHCAVKAPKDLAAAIQDLAVLPGDDEAASIDFDDQRTSWLPVVRDLLLGHTYQMIGKKYGGVSRQSINNVAKHYRLAGIPEAAETYLRRCLRHAETPEPKPKRAKKK